MGGELPKTKPGEWEKIAIFAFGVAFVVLLLVLAIFFPNPTDFQYFIFRTVIALAASGVAALIPGLLHVELPAARAGGALAVFILVYQFSPASLVTQSTPPPKSGTAVNSPPPVVNAPTPITVTYKICTGEYERNCPSHDIYQYCYVPVENWARAHCESFRISRLDTRDENKCGYSIDQVICTSPK